MNAIDSVLAGLPKEEDAVCAIADKHARTDLSTAAACMVGCIPVAVVVGCGGTGWHVAKQLALADICQTIYLVDDDKIEGLNLNRLDVSASYIGTAKCIALCAEIHRVRPEVMLVPVEDRIAATDISTYFVDKNGEVPRIVWVFDCTDSALFQSRLSAECIRLREDDVQLVYTRVSYNGLSHLTIADKTSARILSGADTGYEIVPSWSLPAQLAALFGVYFAVLQTATLYPGIIPMVYAKELIPVIRVGTHYHKLFDSTLFPKE